MLQATRWGSRSVVRETFSGVFLTENRKETAAKFSAPRFAGQLLTFFPTSASTYMRQSIRRSSVLMAQRSPRGEGTISLTL